MMKPIKIFLFLGLSMIYQHVVAQTDQFYFLGSIAPVASLSETGDRAAYLRWDALEAPLPAGIETIVLYRNGEKLKEFPAHGLMTAAEIQALYQEPGQERRLVEMLGWLRRLDPSLDANGLGAAVLQRLGSDELWSLLASRIDFNVARARFHGYLDRDYAHHLIVDEGDGSRSVSYELTGVDGGGAERRLGLVELDPDRVSRLPPASDFRQVFRARCDAPERALDHGVVALDWSQGGTGAAQQFASDLGNAGFDLYRSIENTRGSQFAYSSLTAGSHVRGFDARGQLVVDGLEKVNDQPIMISGSGSDVDPEFAQFSESLPELLQRNIRPGDVRDYYLVARDFSGHYGDAARLKVIVPDLLAPESPWNVELRQNSRDQKLQFRWDAIEVGNFVDFLGSNQQVCNADTARAEGRVAVVGAGQTCGVDTPVEHKLRVDGYLVYRFERFDQAAGFGDTDGDGYSDRDERQSVAACSSDPEHPVRRAYQPQSPEDFQCTDQGTACDANQTPDQGTSHLVSTVDASAVRTLANGRRIVEFADPVQAPGTVYWYRVASYADSGNARLVSELTPPLRAKFNDFTLPERSDLADIVGAFVPNEACWGYETSGSTAVSPSTLAFDHTGDARQAIVGCEFEASSKPGLPPSKLLELPLAADGSGELDAAACALIAQACDVPNGGAPLLNVWFAGATGNLLGERQSINGFDLASCQTTQQVDLNTVYLGQDPTFAASQQGDCPAYRPVPLGESLPEIPLINVRDLPADKCVSIYREIDGRPVRVQQQCGPFNGPLDPQEIARSLPDMALGGERLCLSTALHNENNRVSARLDLGCVSLIDRVARQPSPPQMLDLSFKDNAAIVQWRRPQEPTSATIIEVFDGNDRDSRVVSVQLVGNSDLGLDDPTAFDALEGQGASGLTQSVEIVLESDPAAGEKTYCVQLRSVSSGAWEDVSTTLSERTPRRCETRVPPGETLPEFMAWPTTELPPVGGTGIATWVGQPLVLLSGGLLGPAPAGCSLEVEPAGGYPEGGACADLGGNAAGQIAAQFSAQVCTVRVRSECQDLGTQNITQNVCGQFEASLRGLLNFVVYRQSRTGDTAPAGDYYQVSPLIDRMHCPSVVDANAGLFVSQSSDPFILPLLTGAPPETPDDPPQGFFTAFRDQYPFTSGQQYRYQLVYFDTFGEIVRTRQTNWLTVP